LKQIIDMGGFKNEIIEVYFGKDRYEIQLDPPIEIYRQVISMQGKKIETKEDLDEVKKVVTDIICLGNPDMDKDKFFESLTISATIKFLNAYNKLLYKASGLKNSLNPLSKSKEESKEEKK